jgi:hypothetical protein
MSELTRIELAEAREALRRLGVTSRLADGAAEAVLGYIGQTLMCALLLTADFAAGPSPASVRRAAAAYAAWRKLPSTAAADPHAVCVELGDPHDGNACPRRAAVAGVPELAHGSASPTDDQIDRVLAHLREMV